jgi:hypothetical protein
MKDYPSYITMLKQCILWGGNETLKAFLEKIEFGGGFGRCIHTEIADVSWHNCGDGFLQISESHG